MLKNRKLVVPGLIVVGLLGAASMLASGTGGGASFVADGEGVAWRTDLTAARAEAAETGRPLFLDFTAGWCPPCQEMERDTWPDGAVRELLSASFIPVKLDIDDQPEVAQAFGVQAVPTLVVVAEGKPERRRMGYVGPADMAGWLREQAPEPGPLAALIPPGSD